MNREDMMIKTAVNRVPIALTGQKGAGVPPPVVCVPRNLEIPKTERNTPMEKTMTNENGANVELIDLSLVSVDRTYQRSEKKHAKKIAKDDVFDTNAVGHPVINRRPDKSLWAIDGQQRIIALKLRNVSHWPCRVLHLKTVEQEAELFGRLNGSEKTQSGVSQRDKFRALVAAKNPHVLACIEAIKAGGLELVSQSHRGNPDAWREVDSAGFVMATATVHGMEIVTRAARIVSESWHGSNDATRYLVFGGVMRFVCDFPKADPDRAIARFRTVPAIRVEQEAKKAASFKASGAVPFLVNLYNKGLKSKRLTTVTPTVISPTE
jgi:hypothetical protein